MGASVSPIRLLGHSVLRRVDALVEWGALNQVGKLGTTDYEFQRTLFLEIIGKFIREHVDQMVFVNAHPRLAVNA
jgi:hypothetical protein